VCLKELRALKLLQDKYSRQLAEDERIEEQIRATRAEMEAQQQRRNIRNRNNPLSFNINPQEQQIPGSQFNNGINQLALPAPPRDEDDEVQIVNAVNSLTL